MLGGIGNERALRRPTPSYVADVRHVVEEGIAFDVEFGVRIVFEKCGEVGDVVGTDVAVVWAGMDRDAVGAGVECELGAVQNGGDVERTRVAESGNLVDVDGQLGHGRIALYER